MQKEMNVFEVVVVSFISITNHHHQEHQISAQLQSKNRIEMYLISQHKNVAICANGLELNTTVSV